ncbi:unnamed protein product [Amaranthus hypochondriacus]
MPRLALTFDAVDSTGSINLTAFNDDVANLFGKSIDALYAPATAEEITTYEEIASSFKDKAVCIEVGPTTALSKNGVLKWVLKSILVEPLPPQPNQPLSGQLQPNISSKPIETTEIVVASPPPTKSESSPLFSSSPVAASSSSPNPPSESAQLFSSPPIDVDQDNSQTPTSNPNAAASSSSPKPPAQKLQVRRRLEFGQIECISKPDDNTY